MGKDKVVLRSDIDPLHIPDPFVKHPEKVRNYFNQYGDLDIIYNSHTTRGGLEKYVVVMQFKQPAVANKVKQKYNGRVLMDARVTTSWLDERQIRDLGISGLMLENKKKLKEMRTEGRKLPKGGEKSLSVSDKDSVTSTPRSQSSPHSGIDAESVSTSLYLPEPTPPQTDANKFLTGKLLEQSEQSPTRVPPPKAAAQTRDSVETPDSRASHSLREKESSPRSRKRQHEDEGEKKLEMKKKLPSMELYVPPVKRLKQESMPTCEDEMSIFGRLEQTPGDSFQVETVGELSLLTKATDEKTGVDEISRHSSVSSDSKPSGKSTTSETPTGSERSSRKSPERDRKHSSGKRRSSEREGKHSGKKEKHKHKKSRKSSEKSDKEKKSSKKSRRSSRHKNKEDNHSSEQEMVDETVAKPDTIEPDNTPPINEQFIDPANQQENSVEQWTAWLEYYQQMGYQPEEIVQYIEAAASVPLDSSEGSQEHEVMIPLTTHVEPVSDRSGTGHRVEKTSKGDKNIQASILQEYDAQTFVLATASKILVSKSPHHKEAMTRSLEAALWQIACNLLTKFRDQIDN